MSSKNKNNIKKAKNIGMSIIDYAKVRAEAKKAAEEKVNQIEEMAVEKAFLYMLSIPLNVLVSDYWEKSAKKRIPKFIDECLNLYDAVQNGNVSEEELISLVKEYSGITVEMQYKNRSGNNG